ncbi:tyrosine-type recombinase/integrase [Pseudomonas chlororaphis]|nr:tyrosine-type recombinase/integrase [Pseudomonas chlororaphis]MCO7610579.1 tyrosine-type recombinase/integrase [Pseudomonas chlororaphis]
MHEVVPTKSAATQKDNARELKQLLKFFDDPPAPLDAIEPQHVVQYLRHRGKTAPVRANREKALLSAIWNFARSSGFTALANPCAGVNGQTMTTSMLQGRFDAAREAAGVEKADFQMRDLRAKAGTDKAESSGDILQARDQLGHTTVVVTENYIRKRIGKKVTPTK